MFLFNIFRSKKHHDVVPAYPSIGTSLVTTSLIVYVNYLLFKFIAWLEDIPFQNKPAVQYRAIADQLMYRKLFVENLG